MVRIGKNRYLNLIVVIGSIFIIVISGCSILTVFNLGPTTNNDLDFGPESLIGKNPTDDVVDESDVTDESGKEILLNSTSTRNIRTGIARTGNTNLNISVYNNFSPGYLGDVDKEFFFTVSESYSGEYYNFDDGLPLEHLGHEDALWNLTVESLMFYYNGEAISPINWDLDRSEPDNNNGDGWMVDANDGLIGDVDIYNDAASKQMFRFNVKSSGIMAGNYELRILFKYRLLENYSAWMDRFNFTKINGSKFIFESETVLFEVHSCITSDMQVVAVDEGNNIINNGKLYSGAKNQKLKLNFDIKDPGISLEDVKVRLALPSFLETYTNPKISRGDLDSVSIKSLDSDTPFYWRINTNGTVFPGVYKGTQNESYITYEYTRTDNQIKVVESNKYPIDFRVDHTPLLSPPDTEAMTGIIPPKQQIVQGSTNETIAVLFSNLGNVDLSNIQVGLDLSNSFISAPYYYNAGSSDWKTPLIIMSDSIDQLPIGGSFEANFDVSLFNTLPKGRYLIPISYTAWYFDNGSLSTPTGWVETDEDDFASIKQTYNIQTLDTLSHIAVEVLDDSPDIILQPLINNVYKAGLQNQVLQLSLLNHELYSFHDVTVSIPTSEISPFEHKILDIDQPYLKNQSISTLPAATINGPNQMVFSVLTNIKSTANGYYSIPVQITGWDVYNDLFDISTSFDVSIIPQPPVFIILNAKNSNVVPGENFTLEVTLKNVGYSMANDLELLFTGPQGNTNTFSTSTDGIFQFGDLDVEEVKSMKLTLTADPTMVLGENYDAYMHFKYQDELGNLYSFNDNPQLMVNIRTFKTELKPATEVFAVTNVHSQELTPGSTGTISIKLKNIGSSMIESSSLTHISNSNLLSIEYIDESGNIDSKNYTGNIGSFLPGEERTINFDVTVSKSAEKDEFHSFKLIFTYTDQNGSHVDYNTSDWHEITLKITGDNDLDKNTENDKDSVNWELLMVGVILFVGILLFIMVFVYIFKTSRQQSGKLKGDNEENNSNEIDKPLKALNEDNEMDVEDEDEDDEDEIDELKEQTPPKSVSAAPVTISESPARPATPAKPAKPVEPIRLISAAPAKPAAKPESESKPDLKSDLKKDEVERTEEPEEKEIEEVKEKVEDKEKEKKKKTMKDKDKSKVKGKKKGLKKRTLKGKGKGKGKGKDKKKNSKRK